MSELDGTLRAIVAADRLALSEVGEGDTALRIANPGAEAMRVLFYAGQRQDTPIAWYGPFIGDTRADIARSFERYQAGTFLRV